MRTDLVLVATNLFQCIVLCVYAYLCVCLCQHQAASVKVGCASGPSDTSGLREGGAARLVSVGCGASLREPSGRRPPREGEQPLGLAMAARGGSIRAVVPGEGGHILRSPLVMQGGLGWARSIRLRLCRKASVLEGRQIFGGSMACSPGSGSGASK